MENDFGRIINYISGEGGIGGGRGGRILCYVRDVCVKCLSAHLSLSLSRRVFLKYLRVFSGAKIFHAFPVMPHIR